MNTAFFSHMLVIKTVHLPKYFTSAEMKKKKEKVRENWVCKKPEEPIE